jgi:hypothetical protein
MGSKGKGANVTNGGLSASSSLPGTYAYIGARVLLISLPNVDCYSVIVAMMQTNSEKPCKAPAYGHAFPAESSCPKLCDMTSAVTKAVLSAIVIH